MIRSFTLCYELSCGLIFIVFIVKLRFSVPPQIHQFDFGEEAINSGDTVIATCFVAKGDLPVTIRWSINDKPINELDGVSTMNTNKKASQITIESVQDYHIGKYKCLAENKAGVAEFSTFLKVNGTSMF